MIYIRDTIKDAGAFKLILSEDYLKHITKIIENTNVRDIVVESIKFSDSNLEEMKHILEATKSIEINTLKLDSGECKNLKMSHRGRPIGIDTSQESVVPLYEKFIYMKIEKICCKSTGDLIVLQKLVHEKRWEVTGNRFDWFGFLGGLHLSNMTEGGWNLLAELCNSTMPSISSVVISFEDLKQATLRQIGRLWKTLPITKQFLIDGDRFSFEHWSNSTTTTDNTGVDIDMVIGNMNVSLSEKDSTSNRQLQFLQN